MKQSATLDSSFWINAHRAGLIPAVLERFSIQCAPAVAAELRENFPSGREFWRLVREGVLSVTTPRFGVVTEFGPGERAAMNLALGHPDWVLLIDDRRPLLEAQRLGVRTICTPALVGALFDERRLDMDGALQALARLAALQTVSPVLIAAAVAYLGVGAKEQKGTFDADE